MQRAAQQHGATRKPPTKAGKRCKSRAFNPIREIQREEKQGITTEQSKGKTKTQTAVEQAGGCCQRTSDRRLTEQILGLNSSLRVGSRHQEVGVVVGDLAHAPIIGMRASCPFRVCYADCKRGVTVVPERWPKRYAL